MIKKIINNKDLIFGFIIGMLISAIGVYATTYIGAAADLTYDRNLLSGNWMISSNVQDALDELYKQKGCPVNHECKDITPGMYVSMTPTKTSYTTDTSMTGYDSTQTIYPSQSNLWRVLKINNSGTVDLISEYSSSTSVYFSGIIGYRNFVGYLNTLAKQYENSTYTIGSRYFGYNGQTEEITESNAPTATYFKKPALWKCSTNGSSGDCDPDPDDYEDKGGGDTGYETDYDLVLTALGTRVLYTSSTHYTKAGYWMASRYYYYSSSNYYMWRGRIVSTTGDSNSVYLHQNLSGTLSNGSANYYLRPIVILKSGLKYSGSGTITDPLILSV